jgi:ABC-type transport system substrate-binding protein
MRKGYSKKIVYLGLSLCIVASSFVFACTSPAETPTTPAPSTTPTTTPISVVSTSGEAVPVSTPAPEANPKTGGNLRFVANWTWRSNVGYPPIPSPTFNSFLPNPAIETLLRADDSGLPIPWLATGWSFTPDNKALILTLRHDVKFHDGSDFNAQSVKFYLDMVKDGTSELSAVTSIDIVDDYTLRLNIEEYSNTVLYDLGCRAGSAGAVSATAVQTYGEDWCVNHSVGTGGFKFVSFTRDVELKYERFDDYWIEGKPYLDTIEYSFISDPVTAKTAFLGGEGDVFVSMPPMDAVELQNTGKYNIVSCPQSVQCLTGDSIHPDSPFSKLEVRQAVTYAIDGQALVEAFGYGLIPYTNQVVYPSSYMYNPDVVGYPYNPDKAKELLAAAGYPDGFDTTIYFASNSGQDMAVLIAQRYLADVGINVELQPVSSAKMTELRTKGWENSMILQGGFNTVGYPPAKTMTNYYSQGGMYNVSIIRPDDVQAAFDSALVEPDQEKMVDDLQEMSRLMTDKYCLVTPLFVNVYTGALEPYVKDSKIMSPRLEHWWPEQAWMDK